MSKKHYTISKTLDTIHKHLFLWYSEPDMPHCILEMSSTISAQLDCQAVLEDVHHVLVESGEFNAEDIKVRLFVSELELVGGRENEYVHVTLKLLSGRDITIKHQLSQTLYETLFNWVGDDSVSLSVDIRDMDRGCYRKKAANL